MLGFNENTRDWRSLASTRLIMKENEKWAKKNNEIKE